MKSNLVSIIIAIYNGEKYLKETIDSLLNQTYENIEIIAVINCSNDKTLSLLQAYNDSRIKIYETNICQLVFNLNYALLKSTGEYIVRIDADDIAVEDRIEKQMKIMKKNNYDVIGSNITYIDEYSNKMKNIYLPEFNAQIRKSIYYKCPLVHPSVLYKKDVILNIGGYLNGKVSEDYDLWIRLMRDKTITFYNIQEELLLYRIHEEQSKGSKLAYHEITSYMIREALYLKSFKYLIGFFINLFKSIVK